MTSVRMIIVDNNYLGRDPICGDGRAERVKAVIKNQSRPEGNNHNAQLGPLDPWKGDARNGRVSDTDDCCFLFDHAQRSDLCVICKLAG